MRRLLTLGAVLWIGLAAGAQAQLCAQRHQPTKQERFEARLRDNQGFRRDFGIPAGRRHVIAVMRSRNKRLDYGVALSAREKRYLDRRTLSDADDRRVRAYTERFPDTFGGLSIGNDYPRGAAVVVRFTSDVAGHRRALRALLTVPVRARRVEHSEKELREAQDGIDFDALQAEGIDIRGAGVDIDRSRVVLDVISARPDAVAVVRQHFGPLFDAEVIATSADTEICFGPQSAKVEGATLTLRYETNSAFTFERVFVEETPERVRVGIVERAPNGPVTLVAQRRTAAVTLAAPLGDRRLVSATTGRRIR